MSSPSRDNRGSGWSRRSTVLPLALLVYLAVMSYVGRGELVEGNYLYYFSIIGLSLVCIVFLHVFLRRREQYRDGRNDRNMRR